MPERTLCRAFEYVARVQLLSISVEHPLKTPRRRRRRLDADNRGQSRTIAVNRTLRFLFNEFDGASTMKCIKFDQDYIFIVEASPEQKS